MLVKGRGRLHFADRIVEVNKQALSFSSPLIPCKWENNEYITDGIYCIFNHQFFHQFGDLRQYIVLHPTGRHIFELNDDQANQIQQIFDLMEEEFDSEYIHKYDILRNKVYELIHFALKMEPPVTLEQQKSMLLKEFPSCFINCWNDNFPSKKITFLFNSGRLQILPSS